MTYADERTDSTAVDAMEAAQQAAEDEGRETEEERQRDAMLTTTEELR